MEIALKLDFNKAYDRIQWDFLQAVLLRMGFHVDWVKLVMECVTTISFSVLLMGNIAPLSHPHVVFVKEDPLSPYLFLAVADVLSNLLINSLQEKHISGLQMHPTCPNLSHLFFADDAILFFRADPVECQNILKLLRAYSKATGQILNFD